MQVPDDTPKDSDLYLAGSNSALGNWKANGLKLRRNSDGTFSADVPLKVGETLEYKITRGSWDTVEKNADGSERANRTLAVDANTPRVEITVARWSAGLTDVQSTVVGELKFRTIESKHLGKPRTIRVWLPPGYAADPKARFPVLYMHDGQNLFDRKTSAFGNEWQVDESLTDLILKKELPPLIVVGIDNGGAERICEYTFDADAKFGGGGGERYAKCLLEEVMPQVNEEFRTEVGAAYLGGSSLGGIVSLELAMRHPEAFKGVMAMSPSLWWADEVTLRHLREQAGELQSTPVYLDMGTREGGDARKNVELAQQAQSILSKHNVIHNLLIQEDAEHNEPAWAARFGDAVQYLFAVQKPRK